MARVFLSHSSADKSAALALKARIEALGATVYIDSDDFQLQMAHLAGNHEVVVQRIEHGLAKSTHALVVVSESAKGSWWVPWEAALARAEDKELAHFALKDVERLPAWLEITTSLPDLQSLDAWTRRLPNLRLEEMRKAASARDAVLQHAYDQRPAWRALEYR